MARPLVLPETFSGEGSWDEWITHFENVAAVNAWNTDAAKLQWLKVRLTGRAQKAFQRFAEASKETYARSKEALRERFDPESKRELYAVEFNTKRKRKGEGWADFAEDLRRFADKAYPGLQEEARECLALNSYLSQLSDPQISFAVRQRRPQSVDEAVTATLELESYSKTGPERIAHVGYEAAAVVATVRDVHESDRLMDKLTDLLERIEKLEADSQSAGTESRSGHRRSNERSAGTGLGSGHRRLQQSAMVCRKCGQEGHYARGCAQRQ